VLALIGLAMIVWALPRLARRFGISPVSALWLGAANPLVLFHLVVGVHNEALAIAFMLVGFELALQRMPKVDRTVRSAVATWRAALVRRRRHGDHSGGGGEGAGGPCPRVLGVMIARRLGGRWRHLFATAAALAAVFLVVMVATALGSGLGFGWVTTLNTASSIKSWMAPMTSLGFGAGGLGILLGLGNHIDAAITVSRVVGAVLAH